MNVADLREKDDAQLKQELLDLCTEQFKLRMRKGSGEQVNRNHELKKVRRDIARVKTIQTERKKSKGKS